MSVTIDQLANELVTIVKTSPIISDRGYYVSDTRELESLHGRDLPSLPMAGVTYEGAAPRGNDVKDAGGRPKRSSQGLILRVSFSIIVMVSYVSLRVNETKPDATDLLDDLRVRVLQYEGANSRPWEYVGETPLDTSVDNVVMYGQVWSTAIPVLAS